MRTVGRKIPTDASMRTGASEPGVEQARVLGAQRDSKMKSAILSRRDFSYAPATRFGSHLLGRPLSPPVPQRAHATKAGGAHQRRR